MEKLGNGRMATVYKLNDTQALKLFNKGVPKDYVIDEYNKCKHINELQVSSPKVYNLVEKDGCHGIVYELIKGATYLNLLLSNKEIDDNAGIEMAKVHLEMHKSTSSALDDVKVVIKKAVNVLDADAVVKEKIITYIDNLPDGNTVCHFDFHPDNLIKDLQANYLTTFGSSFDYPPNNLLKQKSPLVEERRLTSKNVVKDENKFTVIDWANAVRGCPAADVYNTVLAISFGTVPPGTPKEVETLINTLRSELVSEYLNYYLEHSDITKDEVYTWELPILVYRYNHGIEEERDFLIERINELVDRL